MLCSLLNNIIITKGKGVDLMQDGFRYKKDKANKNVQYWRCVQSGCSGRAHATKNSSPIFTLYISVSLSITSVSLYFLQII